MKTSAWKGSLRATWRSEISRQEKDGEKSGKANREECIDEHPKKEAQTLVRRSDSEDTPAVHQSRGRGEAPQLRGWRMIWEKTDMELERGMAIRQSRSDVDIDRFSMMRRGREVMIYLNLEIWGRLSSFFCTTKYTSSSTFIRGNRKELYEHVTQPLGRRRHLTKGRVACRRSWPCLPPTATPHWGWVGLSLRELSQVIFELW